MKLTILMPVYNEEATLRQVVERVLATKGEKEVILVDDGSSDSTPEILRELDAAHDEIEVRLHAENAGKGAALATALKSFTGDVVLIQDADLEYDPADYPALLKPIYDGIADVVYGSRFLGGSYGRVHLYHHYLGNRALTMISNVVTNLNLTDMETCYKVFTADIARKLDLRSKSFAVEPEITCKISKMNARIYEVPVSYAGRDYSAGKKIRPIDGIYAVLSILRWGLFH